MDDDQDQLFCTPTHITDALLNREQFQGTILEPAAGMFHIVRALQAHGYADILAADIKDRGVGPCRIEDFLTSTIVVDNIITNPPYKLKGRVPGQAKLLARRKIAMLLPVDVEQSVDFFRNHRRDTNFPWKALYGFVQAIPWENLRGPWWRMRCGWFVFERGYEGPVIRESIMFRKIVQKTGACNA